MKSALFVTMLAALASASLIAPSKADAKQYQTRDGYVVHTRLAPVIAHRISPPFHGRHVYHRTFRR